MYQYECGNCGYDMTGIERVTNTMSVAPYGGFVDMMPMMMMGGFYNSTANNTVTCPNCGKSGYWIKH